MSAVGTAVVAGGRTSTSRAGHAETVAGMATMLPFVAGYIPFALVIGAAIAEHPQPAAGLAATWLLYGGSAQLVLLGLLEAGAAPAVIVLSVLLVNARLALYSASLAPSWRAQPARFRLAAAAMLVDPSWAIARERAARPGSAGDQRRHYLGAALLLWLAWPAAILTGTALGGAAGPGLGLDLAAPLCLLGLLVPRLAEQPHRAAAVAGVAAALAGTRLQPGAGLLLAVAAGVSAGALVDRSRR